MQKLFKFDILERMNTFLIIILSFYSFTYVLQFITDKLNLSHISETVPAEFKDVYDDEKYRKSQDYLKVRTGFSLFQSTVSFTVTIAFILYGGFNIVDLYVRQFALGSIGTGIAYMFVLLFLSQILSIPFSLYSTFVIEERFGFNKTTPKTFIMDFVKSIVLSAVILTPILGFTLWFFESLGPLAWAYVWAFLTAVQLLLAFIAPAFIMPLFNKFEPLKDKELEEKVMTYAKEHDFSLKGLYQMDGSKRSSKSNAFFTGFGSQKRIVLFDTLIEKQSHDELLTVLAHEMGHYKKKHIHKHIITSVISSGVMLFLLSLFMNNAQLFEAFQMQNVSIYTSLVFFGMLYAPIEFVLGVFNNIQSRKHEFEADAYAIETTGLKEPFINALKNLSVDNLSNLTPHPLKEFLEYSHPTVLKRINAINKL